MINACMRMCTLFSLHGQTAHRLMHLLHVSTVTENSKPHLTMLVQRPCSHVRITSHIACVLPHLSSHAHMFRIVRTHLSVQNRCTYSRDAARPLVLREQLACKGMLSKVDAMKVLINNKLKQLRLGVLAALVHRMCGGNGHCHIVDMASDLISLYICIYKIYLCV